MPGKERCSREKVEFVEIIGELIKFLKLLLVVFVFEDFFAIPGPFGGKSLCQVGDPLFQTLLSAVSFPVNSCGDGGNG